MNRLLCLVALALWVVLIVVACSVAPAKTSTKALAAARPAPVPGELAGKLEVRLKSAGAAYTMTRLELVGAQIQFDLTVTRGSVQRVNRFGLMLGGSSNAWDETRAAVRRALDAFPKDAPYILWTSLDADRWWDQQEAAAFLRTIPTAALQNL